MKTIRGKGLVYGVGVNDASYTVQPLIDGKQKTCPIYAKWKNMIKRCYGYDSDNTFSICNEWRYFSNFKAWVDTHPHKDNHLITTSHNYNPTDCIFTSRAIAKLYNQKSGVDYIEKSRAYRARITIDGKQRHLGLFYSHKRAEKEYLKVKKEYLAQRRVAKEQSN